MGLKKVQAAGDAANKAGAAYRAGTVSLGRFGDAMSAVARELDALSPEELAEMKAESR